MAGTTIDGLNSVTSLTSQDKVPVWDAEASGEPTKKITAQNMAASVKTLGSLVNTTEMNNALAGKQNTLTFDTTPTTGSINPVTSGGIAAAIAQSTAAFNNAYTLVSPSEASTTAATFNTYGSRKLSDYRTLYFLLYGSSSAYDMQTIRDCKALPSNSWVSGRSIMLMANHGVNLESIGCVTITYASDTSITAKVSGSGALKGFEILGIPKG